jgi:hypothetical protein
VKATKLGLGAALAAASTLLLSEVALACPACAARESGGGKVFALIGLMIAVPYVITAVTLKVIRRLERDA